MGNNIKTNKTASRRLEEEEEALFSLSLSLSLGSLLFSPIPKQYVLIRVVAISPRLEFSLYSAYFSILNFSNELVYSDTLETVNVNRPT